MLEVNIFFISLDSPTETLLLYIMLLFYLFFVIAQNVIQAVIGPLEFLHCSYTFILSLINSLTIQVMTLI